MSGTTSDDKRHDLLERAKSGEQEAFCELVIECDQVIRNVVRGFIRNIRAYEEDDLVNEVLIRTYKTISEFRGDAIAFLYFLRRTARGLCLNVIRKQGRERQEAEEIKEHIQGTPVRPDETYLKTKMQECVQKAVSLLPEKFKKVVILKDLEGLRYEEIAENLGVPLGTVQSRLGRGREQLKELLKELHCMEML